MKTVMNEFQKQAMADNQKQAMNEAMLKTLMELHATAQSLLAKLKDYGAASDPLGAKHLAEAAATLVAAHANLMLAVTKG